MKPKSCSRKGDFAEYYAVTWLWDQDYEVFKNAGCSGPVDIIATKNKKIILIDVKTFLKRPDQPSSMIRGTGLYPSNKRTKKQKELGVQILGFNPVTRGLRFMEHKDDKSS